MLRSFLAGVEGFAVLHGAPLKCHTGHFILLKCLLGFQVCVSKKIAPAICSPIKSPCINVLSHEKRTLKCVLIPWRREGDLNPRYAYGVYTISNRAHSATLTSLQILSAFCKDAQSLYNNCLKKSTKLKDYQKSILKSRLRFVLPLVAR